MKPVDTDDIVLFTEETNGIFFFETSNGEVFYTSVEQYETR